MYMHTYTLLEEKKRKERKEDKNTRALRHPCIAVCRYVRRKVHKPNAELERPTRTGLFFFSLLLLALGFKGNLEVGDNACMILYSTCTSTQELFGSFLFFVVFFVWERVCTYILDM